MRFSTIFFPFVVLFGLVLASPIEERGESLSIVESKTPVDHKYEPGVAHIIPNPAGSIKAGGKTEVKPDSSKRSEYNQLDGRAPVYFVACLYKGCITCYSYTLYYPRCYGTINYLSAYVSSSASLSFSVYAALGCNGVQIPYLNTCYDVKASQKATQSFGVLESRDLF